MPADNQATTVTVMWWTVQIDGEQPAITPALTAEQALWTVQATLNQAGVPHQASNPQQITNPQTITRWVSGYEEQLRRTDLPNPTPWRQALYETIRTQHHPDATPPPPPTRIDPRPYSSRAPNLTQDTALQATIHQLYNLTQPLILAAALLTALYLQARYIGRHHPPTFLILAATTTLTFAVFTTQWLNRLDQPPNLNTMKWCTTCNTTTPTNHQHPRLRHRNHSDEYQRRRILNDYRNTVGEWCRGTQWCDPGGHTTTPTNPLTVDHTLPQSLGGTLQDGFRVICQRANSARGNKPIGT